MEGSKKMGSSYQQDEWKRLWVLWDGMGSVDALMIGSRVHSRPRKVLT
jgi:hypothetical protein